MKNNSESQPEIIRVHENDGIEILGTESTAPIDFIKEESYINKNDNYRFSLVAIFIAVCMIAGLLAVATWKKENSNYITPETISSQEVITVTMPPIEVTMPTVPETTAVIESREFVITGYCICIKCCHKTDGITASGVKVQEGITCAADWSVLAPGSIVDIEGIGVRTVQDKGSSVKGDHIDVYMTDHQTALNFGRQTRTVTIIKEGK